MKTYDELTPEQQAAALDKAKSEILRDMVSGMLRFSDKLNGDTLQASIDAAMAEAEAMRTPWFAGEYVMDARYFPGDGHIVEDDGLWPVAEAITSFARPIVEDALYPETGERTIQGVA